MYQINLKEDILQKQRINLDAIETDSGLQLNEGFGKGFIEQLSFKEMDLFYYKYILNSAHQQHTFNPLDSEQFVLMVNLSKKAISKVVDGKEVSIQIYQPIGMIVYPPGCSVESVSLPHQEYEMLVIRFSKAFLSEYFNDYQQLLEALKSVIYEDLTLKQEGILNELVERRKQKIEAHSLTLKFIGLLMNTLINRNKEEHWESIHPADMKGLFLASASLRNPTDHDIPTISDLSMLAEMSSSKFKKLFKQVFGCAPIQFHFKIKMDYAQKEMAQKNRTASELSYELGYSHPSKFTKAYKKHFGILPSEQAKI